MVVYLDLVIGSTVLVNFAFLKSIATIFHEKIHHRRMFSAILLSVVSLFLFLVPAPFFYGFRYLIGLPIAWIAFPNTGLKQKIMKVVVFYLLNMAFIGTLVVFSIRNIWWMVVALCYIIVLWVLENYKIWGILENSTICTVYIDKQVLKGFIDTGNQSYYFGIPVVYIKEKYRTDQYHKIGVTEIQVIGSRKTIAIFQGPLLKMGRQTYIVYYSFQSDLAYDVILNQELKGDYHD